MQRYFDHAATAPMRPEVIDAYAEAMRAIGNPASVHMSGQRARQSLEESREIIAAGFGCDPIEVVFTSGGTESINLALKGLWWRRDRGAIVLPEGEHHATMDAAEWLESREGAQLRHVPLVGDGTIDVAAFADAVAPASGKPAALATAMLANNEVGTIQPIEDLASIAHEAGVPLHCDAVASLGQLDVAQLAKAADCVSVSAHKIGGPVGIGALIVRRGVELDALMHGGGQQRGIRSGTQDVAAARAFAVAMELALAERETEAARVGALRDRLAEGIRSKIAGIDLNGAPLDSGRRLPGNLNIAFHGAQNDSLIFALDMAGFAVSAGSACQAGVARPSHVVLALGKGEDAARGSIRFTLGRETEAADVDALLAALPGAVETARKAGWSERDVPAYT